MWLIILDISKLLKLEGVRVSSMVFSLLLLFSVCQAFKAIKSFLSKLETVSDDPTKLAEIGIDCCTGTPNSVLMTCLSGSLFNYAVYLVKCHPQLAEMPASV